MQMAAKCKVCGQEFENGHQLGGHQQAHKKSFEQLSTDGARKNRLINERGLKCEICKLTDWCGTSIPIELDHIDGNPENSSKDNLRLICPNCHAQTETYRGKNMGKVQNSKRKETLKKYYGKYR